MLRHKIAKTKDEKLLIKLLSERDYLGNELVKAKASRSYVLRRLERVQPMEEIMEHNFWFHEEDEEISTPEQCNMSLGSLKENDPVRSLSEVYDMKSGS